jgi:hypothetical protein
LQETRNIEKMRRADGIDFWDRRAYYVDNSLSLKKERKNA